MLLQTIDKIFSNDNHQLSLMLQEINLPFMKILHLVQLLNLEYDILVGSLSPPSPQPQVRSYMVWMTVEELSIICDDQPAPERFVEMLRSLKGHKAVFCGLF